jgi:hypothetical protein
MRGNHRHEALSESHLNVLVLNDQHWVLFVGDEIEIGKTNEDRTTPIDRHTLPCLAPPSLPRRRQAVLVCPPLAQASGQEQQREGTTFFSKMALQREEPLGRGLKSRVR